MRRQQTTAPARDSSATSSNGPTEREDRERDDRAHALCAAMLRELRRVEGDVAVERALEALRSWASMVRAAAQIACALLVLRERHGEALAGFAEDTREKALAGAAVLRGEVSRSVSSLARSALKDGSFFAGDRLGEHARAVAEACVLVLLHMTPDEVVEAAANAEHVDDAEPWAERAEALVRALDV